MQRGQVTHPSSVVDDEACCGIFNQFGGELYNISYAPQATPQQAVHQTLAEQQGQRDLQ